MTEKKINSVEDRQKYVDALLGVFHKKLKVLLQEKSVPCEYIGAKSGIELVLSELFTPEKVLPYLWYETKTGDDSTDVEDMTVAVEQAAGAMANKLSLELPSGKTLGFCSFGKVFPELGVIESVLINEKGGIACRLQNYMVDTCYTSSGDQKRGLVLAFDCFAYPLDPRSVKIQEPKPI